MKNVEPTRPSDEGMAWGVMVTMRMWHDVTTRIEELLPGLPKHAKTQLGIDIMDQILGVTPEQQAERAEQIRETERRAAELN